MKPRVSERSNNLAYNCDYQLKFTCKQGSITFTCQIFLRLNEINNCYFH